MKRVIALTMAVLMIAALLVACGGPEGKYVVKSIDGKAVDEAIKESAEENEKLFEEINNQQHKTINEYEINQNDAGCTDDSYVVR